MRTSDLQDKESSVGREGEVWVDRQRRQHAMTKVSAWKRPCVSQGPPEASVGEVLEQDWEAAAGRDTG